MPLNWISALTHHQTPYHCTEHVGRLTNWLKVVSANPPFATDESNFASGMFNSGWNWSNSGVQGSKQGFGQYRLGGARSMLLFIHAILSIIARGIATSAGRIRPSSSTVPAWDYCLFKTFTDRCRVQEVIISWKVRKAQARIALSRDRGPCRDLIRV